MSVRYDYDPGRLELYRPRPDGLMSRCFCGSALIHLLVGCVLLTVRLPQPPPVKRRQYRITEVRLLPRPQPAPTPAALPQPPRKLAQTLEPKDLSLFLHDLSPVPKRARRLSRRERRAQHRSLMATRPAAPNPANDLVPDQPNSASPGRNKSGKQMASRLPALPDLLERQMAESRPFDPLEDVAPAPARAKAKPAPKPVDARPVAEPKPAMPPTPPLLNPSLAEVTPPKPVVHRRHVRVKVAARKPIEPLRQVSTPAPKPVAVRAKVTRSKDEGRAAPHGVRIARAVRPELPADLLAMHPVKPSVDEHSTLPAISLPKPTPASEERPTDLPSGREGRGKRVADLPGDLSGTGTSLSKEPSHRAPTLPEGRSGAAAIPGPRRPRLTHGGLPSTEKSAAGDAAGITPIPAPGGARLPASERPDAERTGGPESLVDRGGKGARQATLPATAPEAGTRGSGSSAKGDGVAAGVGDEAPRALGGNARPGRPRHVAPEPSRRAGDGLEPKPSPDAGIGIDGPGTAAGGASTDHPGGKISGDEPTPVGNGSGKVTPRADLPADGGDNAGGRSGGSGHTAGDDPKASGSKATGGEGGPKSFDTGGRRHSTPQTDGGEGESGKSHGKGGDRGDGDTSGVALPGGGGDVEEGPGRDNGDDQDSGLKTGRRKPSGVYVTTTGRYTLPAAEYPGDYQYNTRALRVIMDELNRRTKVKVRLGGSSVPIDAELSKNKRRMPPVVVFTGHKKFELTEVQRQALKEYVAKGGMVWADLSHSAFDQSFRQEMETIFGSAPVALPSGHAIFNSFYKLSGPPKGEFGDDKPFEGINVDGRLGVVITPNRYFSAVTRSLNTNDEDQEGAIQAVVNVYMYAAGNYSAAKDAGE